MTTTGLGGQEEEESNMSFLNPFLSIWCRCMYLYKRYFVAGTS